MAGSTEQPTASAIFRVPAAPLAVVMARTNPNHDRSPDYSKNISG
jgi:hypothetical protein